jgi:hypothetical protein
MLTYPQLAHFPIVKRRRRRTVVNRMGDGRTVKLSDAAGEVTEWRLAYAELSDTEAGALQEFFLAAEGSLNDFVFVDPTANLLLWSDRLDIAAWAAGPMLSVAATGGAWEVANAGAGPQAITQTIEAPPGFVYCFSLYAKSETPGTVRLLAGGVTSDQAIGSEWRRLKVSGAMEDPTFGIEVAAEGLVWVRGMQVEAQAGASAARVSTTGGVYEGARLRDDWIEMMATGLNRHSCTVNIVHANHI